MAKFVAYPAVLDNLQNEDETYTVTFPDVPGVISQGNTIADAMGYGAEALGLMLYDQHQLPHASNIEAIQQQYSDCIVTLVVTNLDQIAATVVDVNEEDNK